MNEIHVNFGVIGGPGFPLQEEPAIMTVVWGNATLALGEPGVSPRMARSTCFPCRRSVVSPGVRFPRGRRRPRAEKDAHRQRWRTPGFNRAFCLSNLRFKPLFISTKARNLASKLLGSR